MHHHPRGDPEPRKADAGLRSERTDGLSGILFVVATPIGNLEDITLRALRVLREVDLVACEDTRRTRALLTHFDIHKPTVSYYEQNKLARGPQLLRDLAAVTAIGEVFGEVELVLARELTKQYEEIVTATPAVHLGRLAAATPRGEFTLLIPAGG